MTRFLLVRHAAVDPVGVAIAGRAPGVPLNDAGREQASRIASAMAAVTVGAVYTSPLERARETAEPIARAHGLDARVNDAFTEVDFGEWTGQSLRALGGDERWRRFNTFRSGERIPGGELMAEAQLRAVRGLEQLRGVHGDATVVIVSHADVIRATLAYYLGMPIDLMQRLEIAPASVSALALDDWCVTVTHVNDEAYAR